MRMVARMLRGGSRRVAEGDVEDLKAMLSLRAELDGAIVGAVRGLRESGWTWREIGAAAGTTGQAANMRWGPLL